MGGEVFEKRGTTAGTRSTRRVGAVSPRFAPRGSTVTVLGTGLEMKNLHDVKDLTIHDVKPLSIEQTTRENSE